MMGTKQFKIKKIIILSIAILFIFILALFIWLILPGPEATLISLIPAEAFAYTSLKMSLSDPGISDLVNDLKSSANNPHVRFKERFLIKFIMPLFLPVEVATTFILNPDTKNPDYLVFVKNNRLARIFRLSALLRLNPAKGYFYTVFKDILIVSKKPLLLNATLDSFGKDFLFVSDEVLDNFRQLKDTKDGVVFINNVDVYFLQFIKGLERKNAFIIFPTVDLIKWIGGYLDIVNADKAKGSLIFKYKELTNVAEVEKDVHFFAEVLRRFFKASGMNFTREMINYNESIDLNFEISGLKTLMVDLLSKKRRIH